MTVIISCGEPAGIGPEVAARAWDALRSPMLWIGDPRHLPPGTPVAEVAGPEEAEEACARALPVLARDFGAPVVPGRPDPTHAQPVIDAIRDGVDLIREGRARALCTAPISKAALVAGAGFAYPGHTEYLAHLGGDADVVMMLACEALRVVPATIHVALSEVPRLLTADLLERVLRVTHAALRDDWGVPEPRIAVAGLNPHAGEDGLMGTEEGAMIRPLLDRLRAEGMHLSGPHSPDTMFHDEARATYDAAVCMYHDQALIPIKTLDFARGVNVTAGLPFVRTSPDHGTAFGIAGQGRADPRSMIAALELADRLSRQRGTPWRP
ncbi:4-hydroxythreonine-4-phosphate dehydrogenase PdxA [Rubellimicrobium roseum]|uniref:4-hydroxythreonine-4-phosphate dehydrogenase n=1 Tax=Rubellimicrobium roseum TaxID=687525 RepID=A0A5C4NH14_9RHOB|nr:4-hydroxythreonine-4-phosphate dehydrogenase PdxA [Rubellimicrobium roseum]TNC73372.1 4-hydroxythreonine-4-phosphate dehydrogenase PdxA [Rubellimicrobium roseum]